jgi:PAS domain S-box-containing protein
MPLRQLLHGSSSQLQAEMQLILNALVEGVCGADAHGNATFCNEALLRITGYQADEVIGKNLHALLHRSRPDGTSYPEGDCPLRQAFESQRPVHAMREILWRKDGTCLPVEYHAHPLLQPTGLTSCVITVHDISEREQAAAAMRTSEERFQQISKNIDQAFYLVDVTASRLVYASPAFETITGRSCQEVCDKPSPWRDYAVPEHRARVVADYSCLLAGEETKSEYQIRHGDGSTRWVKDHAKPIRDANGRVCMFAGVAEDITAIHEARDILRRSEERFRRILASVAEVAWTSDQNRRTIYISPKVEEVLGYTKEEICAGGGGFRSGLIHPEDYDRVNQSYRALFEYQSTFDEEYRIRRKDGGWIWIHDRATGIHEEDGIPYADGVFSDITQRKQAEVELQSKTAFLEAQANSTIDGILVVGGNNKRLLHNQRFVELFHISSELANNKDDALTLRHVTGLTRDPESFLARINYLNQHPAETSHDEIELKDGTVIDRYSAPVIDKEGRHYGRIWTFRDITQRKRNEERLRRSEAYLAESQRLSHIGSFAWKTSQPESVFWSDEHYRIFGLEPGDGIVSFEQSLRGIHPEDLKHFRSVLNKSMEEKKDYEMELRIVLPDGSIRDIHAIGHPMVSETGELVEMIGLSQDVTERKRAERDLRLNLFAVEHASDSFEWIDPNGRLLYVNEVAYRSLGFSREEMLSLSIPDINPTFSKAYWKTWWSEIKSQRSKTFESQRQTKQGRRFPVEITANYLEFDGREYCFAHVHDITQRKRNEETLQNLSLAVEQSPASVMITNARGNISYVNQKFTEITGYKLNEVLGRNPRFLNARVSPPSLYRDLWSTITQGKEWRGELCNRKKSGRVFWESVKIRPITDRTGATTHYLAVKEDITERRRAEQELRASRQLLQSILDAIPQRVFWKTRNCNYLGCNRPFAKDAGLDSPEAIVGKSDFELSWKDVAELYRAEDKLVMEQKSPKLDFCEHQTRPDGTVLWLQTNKLPLLDADGNVIGVVGTYEDITERRRAEQELRLAKASLQNSSDAVYWLDSNGRIVYVNEAACRALGRSRDELLSLSVMDIDPPCRAVGWQTLWERVKAQGSLTFESQNETKKAKIFPVEITANYLEFDGQEYSLAFVRDISERRELESQLRQAHKLEGIGQLAAGIAHEINTPTQFVSDNLTFLRDSWKATHKLLDLYRSTIRNAEPLLADGVAAELEETERDLDLEFIVAEVPRAIEQSLDGAHRVAKIVRAMKEFSYRDSAEKTETDLNRSIESTITVARNEWKYVAELTTEFDDKLPRILCYPGDINQVILNLVVNAAHAIKEKLKDGEKGLITVGTRRRGEFAEISVTDTGAGIPETVRSRIFDPFFTTKEVGKGTGQGLSLAHTLIVKKHSGKIWFDTEVGRGTTFFIHLPIKPAEQAD